MIISVTQLNNYLKGVIDMDAVLSQIEVSGEVTNYKQSGQSVYFSLKDENSQIDCFCYSDANIQLQSGTQIIATGTINFLPKSGRISFFVKSTKATSKQGEAYLAFLALKEKLDKEGLFDIARKKAVPVSAKKIGVVTSKSGAVIQDIQSVVFRRQPFSDILLYDVRVQGTTAPIEIAQGIKYFEGLDVDVVIIARGGGSNEDLSAFNDEKVVRAVANCTKPTISAIGHGIDYTLTDFVADRRAVTPTEAAELITLDSIRLQQQIVALLKSNYNILLHKISSNSQLVRATTNRMSALFANKMQSVYHSVITNLKLQKATLDKKLYLTQSAIEKIMDRVSYSNPMAQLARGYASVTVKDKRISSIKQLQPNDNAVIQFADGKALTIVKKLMEK